MKYYETRNVNFFVEKLDWDRCSRYPLNKTWEYKPKDNVRVINFYRDHEAPWRTEKFTRHCYYLKEHKWEKNRIVPWACLPIYYVGYRFIKLQQAPPLGFKCREFPMNLREYNAKSIELERLEEERLKKEKFRKAVEAQCRKAAKKKKRK